MTILTTRELFSLYSFIYINLHLILLFNNYNFYPNFFINYITFYSLIDTIWIFYDNKVKVSKYELVIHHLSTIYLINLDINIEKKLQILIIETTTLILLLLRISSGNMKQTLYYIFLISWISLRIIWLYIYILNYKFNKTYLNYAGYHGFQLFLFLNIYLLGIKWTLDFMKITKYTSYTSTMLLLPLVYNMNIVPNYTYTSIINLTIISFIHHLIKSKITMCLDEFAITNTCLTYIGFNYKVSVPLSLISYISKYFNSSIPNIIIYSSVLFYYMYQLHIIKLNALIIVFGFYLFKKYNYTFLWHFSNGIYLTIVSNYIYN